MIVVFEPRVGVSQTSFSGLSSNSLSTDSDPERQIRPQCGLLRINIDSSFQAKRSGDPKQSYPKSWIPAFAGMTPQEAVGDYFFIFEKSVSDTAARFSTCQSG